jgi:aminoglycoside phosphotransferase (APT) family kinase protein
VLERLQVHGRTVVIERRLPGTDALAQLGRPATDRDRLVLSHLDATARIADLPSPVDRFGEIWGSGAINTTSFAAWSEARLGQALAAAPDAYHRLDAADLTRALVEALDEPEPERPVVVHLDAFLGNMLCDRSQITAVLDFGVTTIAGPRDLDAAVAVAYLDPEITPTATDADRGTATAWAAARGITGLLAPARRWVASYWTPATDDQALQCWCRRVLEI